MKTVFFGTPDFALSSAESCFKHSELLAVVTQPDRPRGRGQKLQPCEVKAWAQEKNLPSFSPSSLRKQKLTGEELAELESFWSFIQEQKPDLFVVTAYGNIIPEEVLNFSANGSINLHGSLLPRWRGAAPIQRALEAGDSETGVCLQQMVYELDAGDVLCEAKLDLGLEHDAFSLTASLRKSGGELLDSFLQNPSFQGAAQDAAQVTYARKIEKSEGFWSPTWSAMQSHNAARAFVAWPGVKAQLFSSADGPSKTLKFVKTHPVSNSDWENLCQDSPEFAQAKEAGDLFLIGKRVFLTCSGPKPQSSSGQDRTSEPRPGSADNWSPYLELLEVQLAGKAPGKAFDCLQNIFQNSAENQSFRPRLGPLDGAAEK